MTLKIDEPIVDVKKKIREQEGMDVDEKFALVYKSVVLREGKSLADYMDIISKEKRIGQNHTVVSYGYVWNILTTKKIDKI